MMLDAKALKAGDVVRLACGSPKMVVVSVRALSAGPPGHTVERPAVVDVIWHVDRLGLQKAALAPELLVYPATSTAPRPADSTETEAE